MSDVTIDEATRRVADALAELGRLSYPGLVANVLSAAGVRGRRNWCGSCPLAVYLRQLSDARDVVVSRTAVSVRAVDPRRALEPFPYVYRRVAQLPSVVAHFVLAIDAGGYPELECDDE